MSDNKPFPDRGDLLPPATYLYTDADSVNKQTITKIFKPMKDSSPIDYIDHPNLSEAELDFIRDFRTGSGI